MTNKKECKHRTHTVRLRDYEDIYDDVCLNCGHVFAVNVRAEGIALA